MVEPLHADLPPGALPHGLFHKVARLVAEQAVDPPNELPLGWSRNWGWRLKVQLSSQLESLAVTMPPVTTFPGEGVPLADALDIGGILSSRVVTVALIQLLNSGWEQNLSGRPKAGPARRCAPHVPAAAGLQLRPKGRGILGTQGGILHAAAGVRNTRSFSVRSTVLLCPRPAAAPGGGLLCGRAGGPELHVHHQVLKGELDAMLLQVL